MLLHLAVHYAQDGTFKVSACCLELIFAERLLAVLSHMTAHKHRLLHPLTLADAYSVLELKHWVLRRSC